jgi:rubrerythrin
MAKQIREELHDSEKYIECAMKYKDSDKDLADMYYNLASEEMTHADKVHNQVVREIRKAEDEYRDDGKESTLAVMHAVWDYEHDNLIEEAAEVKTKIDMYSKTR